MNINLTYAGTLQAGAFNMMPRQPIQKKEKTKKDDIVEATKAVEFSKTDAPKK